MHLLKLLDFKGRYVFLGGGRAGASEGRVTNESEHQRGEGHALFFSYSREGHTPFPEFLMGIFEMLLSIFL